jgi:hypothetical protein
MGQDEGVQTPRSARPAALLAIRISPNDVGQRVSIRHRIVDEQASLTDLLGYLRSWGDGLLLVEQESGETRAVLEKDVVAAKVIPPKSVRKAAGEPRVQP